MKRCNRCTATKPFDEFHKSCNTNDGLHTYCKTCRSELHKIYRSRPEVHKAIVEKIKYWRNNHGRDKYLAYRREYDKSFKRTLWRRIKYNVEPRVFKNKPMLHPKAIASLCDRILAARKLLAEGNMEAYMKLPDSDRNSCNAWSHATDEEIRRKLSEY